MRCEPIPQGAQLLDWEADVRWGDEPQGPVQQRQLSLGPPQSTSVSHGSGILQPFGVGASGPSTLLTLMREADLCRVAAL